MRFGIVCRCALLHHHNTMPCGAGGGRTISVQTTLAFTHTPWWCYCECTLPFAVWCNFERDFLLWCFIGSRQTYRLCAGIKRNYIAQMTMHQCAVQHSRWNANVSAALFVCAPSVHVVHVRLFFFWFVLCVFLEIIMFARLLIIRHQFKAVGNLKFIHAECGTGCMDNMALLCQLLWRQCDSIEDDLDSNW